MDANGKLIRSSAVATEIWTENNSNIYPSEAGDSVLIGGALPASPNITLNADGTGVFGGDAEQGANAGVKLAPNGRISVARAATNTLENIPVSKVLGENGRPCSTRVIVIY